MMKVSGEKSVTQAGSRNYRSGMRYSGKAHTGNDSAKSRRKNGIWRGEGNASSEKGMIWTMVIWHEEILKKGKVAAK